MEWVLVKNVRRELQFTVDEKTELLRMLSPITDETALSEQFIKHLAGTCGDYAYYLEQPNIANARKDLSDTLPVLKNALKIVNHLKKNGAPVGNMNTVPGADDRLTHFESDKHQSKSYFEVPTLARDTASTLAQLIPLLEELQPCSPGRGRPKNEGGFAQAIYDVFVDYFKVTPSMGEGLLIEILSLCLGGMATAGIDVKYIDPSRRIRSVRHK